MLLIDADIIAMRFACKHEQRWEFPDNEQTSSDDPEALVTRFAKEAERDASEFVEGLAYKLNVPDDDFKLCFTGGENWRKQLFPTYKHNRLGKWIPELRNRLTQFLMEKYPFIRVAQLEADDLLGILQTERNARKEPSIIATVDKDLRQIPGWHYNWNKDDKPVYVTEEEGFYMHMYQTLKGDPTDGYSGCPKCGDAKARKLLPKKIKGNEKQTWEIIVSAYMAQKLTEADALNNARMAYILRAGDFELKPNRKVRLWTPKHKQQTEWKEF